MLVERVFCKDEALVFCCSIDQPTSLSISRKKHQMTLMALVNCEHTKFIFWLYHAIHGAHRAGIVLTTRAAASQKVHSHHSALACKPVIMKQLKQRAAGFFADVSATFIGSRRHIHCCNVFSQREVSILKGSDSVAIAVFFDINCLLAKGTSGWNVD